MERQLALYLKALPLEIPYFLPIITFRSLSRNLRSRTYFPGLMFVAPPTPLQDIESSPISIREAFQPTFDIIKSNPIHRRLLNGFLLTELQSQLRGELIAIWEACDQSTRSPSSEGQPNQPGQPGQPGQPPPPPPFNYDGRQANLTSLPEIAGSLRRHLSNNDGPGNLVLEFPLLGRILEMPVQPDQITLCPTPMN
jgi:hypothetical protein